jgi:tRNA-specific 2-thiouridylase
LFVVRLDAATRQVIVGPREALLTTRISVSEMNWLGDGEPNGQGVLARVRSTRPPVPGRLVRQGDAFEVHLDAGEEGVAPGQACVLYDPENAGSRVLGGGWITAAR